MGTVKNAIKFLNGAVKQTDEVIESSVKNINVGTVIKNNVNSLDSNMTKAQRVVKNMNSEAGQLVPLGKGTARNQIDFKTTTKAMDNGLVPRGEQVPISNNKEPIIIIGSGNSNTISSKYQDMVNNAIDLEPSSKKTSRRRGNRTQQPETPDVIYMNENPDVINMDGPRIESTKTNTNQNTQQQRTTTNQKTTTNKQKGQGFSKFTDQAKDMFLGGVTDTYKGYKDGQGIVDSFVNAHKHEDGSIKKLRAAGTFMTASAAARVASGGGLYKDRYGNPNLIGVPFI